MKKNEIQCPECETTIELTEVLTKQIESGLKKRIQQEEKEREAKFNERMSGLAALEATIKAKEDSIEDMIAMRLADQKVELLKEATEKASQESELKVKRLNDELEEKSKKVIELQSSEVELRKKQRELEEMKSSLELEATKKIEEERVKIAEDIREKSEAEHRLKLREKDEHMKAMKRQIDELKRKSEVSSQERQGEALEGELFEVLEGTFPVDEIEEIKKGERGADILQTVKNSALKTCGLMLWESKNTKEFQKKWITKLKKDQQDKGASVAILLSTKLPKEISGFGYFEGVWITDYKSALGLATALRQGIVEVARQKVVTDSRSSIRDVVYEFVTGKEFAQQMTAVVNAYKGMQDDLEAEKRAMTRIWKKREKQISTVLENVTGIYGSVEGILSAEKAIKPIEVLALESPLQNDTSPVE
jgi:hypothetical protein